MMNSGEVRVWNEVVSIYFKVLSRNFSGQIEKIEEEPDSPTEIRIRNITAGSKYLERYC
jgi:hypothetical protein